MRQVPKLCIAGLLSVLLTMTSSVYADSTADLKQAEKLCNQRQYAQAEQLYEKILAEADEAQTLGKNVDSDLVFTAHKKLPLLYLATNQQAEAKAGVETLLGKYADRQDLPQALHEIMEGAKKIDKTSQAGQICVDILTTDPKHKDALWLKMGVALANVYLRDDQAVNAAVQSIVAEQGSDPWAAEALAQTGKAYDNRNRCDKSRPIYEYIVDNWPQKNRTLYAHTALVRACILLRDEEAAQTRLEQLIKRYPKDDDLPVLLTQIGSTYQKAKMYDPARQVSRYVLDNFADSDACLWAQRDIVLCDITQEAWKDAVEGIEVLQTKFADHTGIVSAIADVAMAFSGNTEHERARELLAFNVKKYAGTPESIWSLRDYIQESVFLNDTAAIETALKTLLSTYTANDNFPVAAVDIGRILLLADSPKAAEVLQYVIDKHPDDHQASIAKVCLGHIQVRQGKDAEAEAIYAKVLADDADDPYLAETVHVMAQGYQLRAFQPAVRGEVSSRRELSDATKAYLLKAVEKWQYIVTQLPVDTETTPTAYYSLTRASEYLGDLEKAFQYASQLVERWPDHEMGWRAQNRIVKLYQSQIPTDAPAEDSPAAKATKQAAEKLLAEFPVSPVAPIIEKKLGRSNTDTQGGEK